MEGVIHVTHKGTVKFRCPREYAEHDSFKGCILEEGVTLKLPSIIWISSFIPCQTVKTLPLTRSYYDDTEFYEEFTTYDAINVDRLVDIPYDYEWIMGVPISILQYLDRDQFEVLGTLHHRNNPQFYDFGRPICPSRERYVRILIRNRNIRR